MVLITTRKAQDMSFGDATDNVDSQGPGETSPGDVAMAELLGDNGYSCRIIPDAFLNANIVNPCSGNPGNPNFYLYPSDSAFDVGLVILSGSSGSPDVPFINPNNGIPIMIGEHVCLGDRVDRACVCYMYSHGTNSGNIVNPNGGQYMKVIVPNHPIMQGIPLDAQGRVKIMRDPYPEEGAHRPLNGKDNYEYSWPIIPAANAAPGTTVLGLLEGDTNQAVFAVNDVGGLLSNGEANKIRLVHFFVNEDGAGGARRAFNALTPLGRVLFVRAAKWAMGETLTPFQGVGIVDVTHAGSQRIRLSWQASATYNYKILGTTNLGGPADFSNWETIVQDIPGTNGVVSRTLDISAAAQAAFLRIAPMP
jgi:hypothetical protein